VKKQLMMVGMIASTFGLLAPRSGYAEIIAADASGPGGTVHNLSINTLVNFHDAVGFYADYTSRAGINVDVTVDSPGIYYVGYVNITNDTSSAFPSFYAYLTSSPAGSVIAGASYSSSTFSNGVTFSPPAAATSVSFNGPPGIGPGGDSTSLYVILYIPPTAMGTQSFDVLLTPVGVPEPSSFVVGLLGAIPLVVFGARRVRHTSA
jgi:hypothetical protein